MSNTTFNLKRVFNDCYGWNEGFKFEVIWSNTCVARIYINDRKTRYYVGGYGYDKESSVIANMINDLLSDMPYDYSVYGNTRNYKHNTSDTGTLCGGTGFNSIKASFESLGVGYKLNKLYSGKYSNVYEIQFNKGA